MRKIFPAVLLLFCFQMAQARKLVVTSSSDNVSAPTTGMLRYFIKNFKVNDTIIFSVPKVNLLGELKITSSVIIDGGVERVTIDGGGKFRLFKIDLINATEKIVIKNLIL